MSSSLEVESACKAIQNTEAPVGERMRAIFAVRSFTVDADLTQGLDALCSTLSDKANSCLMRHEVAYVLGQMKAVSASPTLTTILRDTTDDAIVRHECAEALGAIGDADTSLAVLTEFLEDPAPEVSETCRIAIDRVNWILEQQKQKGNDNDEADPDNEFHSIDPAPASTEEAELSVEQLEEKLMDVTLSLFLRYRAMFGLRNKKSEAAVLALCKGLKAESALFRHEVAYVLGQLEHEASVDALSDSLKDLKEHGMVRHEAAEALGAIGTDECLALLREFRLDDAQVVRESCDAALDTAQYWVDFAKDKSADDSSGDTIVQEEEVTVQA